MKTVVRRMTRPALAIIVSIMSIPLAAGCLTFVAWMIRPSHDFSDDPVTGTPDYSSNLFWAALPETRDEADIIPADPEIQDQQYRARVDVFFVHPTSYISDKSWNADASSYSTRINDQDVVQQASVFNGSAKIYAPRYRQATMGTFAYLDSEDSQHALDRAYEDVRAAFLYYRKNLNQGRPYILAGHSQGAFMVVRLMQEFLDVNPKSMDDRFIIAYAPGAAIHTDDFEYIRPCEAPDEIRCYVSWNSRAWGVEEKNARLQNSVCVNPISWNRREDSARREKHMGSIRKDFQTLDRNNVEARCKESLLWVRLKHSEYYESSFQKSNFHPVDFNLFYLDIRRNLELRIHRYFQTR